MGDKQGKESHKQMIEAYKDIVRDCLMDKYGLSINEAEEAMEDGYHLSKKLNRFMSYQLHYDAEDVAEEIYKKLDKYREQQKKIEAKRDKNANNTLTFGYFRPWYNIPSHFKQIGRVIKFSTQRILNGYCDYDRWDIDSWFLKLFPKMLDEFAEKTHGYPPSYDKYNKENDFGIEYGAMEWEKTVKEMAQHFRNAAQDYYDMYPDELYAKSFDKNRWEEYNKYISKELHEGMQMFEEHFFHLWD